jgi:hypothetical protein
MCFADASSALPSAVSLRRFASARRRRPWQLVGVLQHVAQPLDRGEDLRRAHVAVAVGVEQRERALVDLEALRRAAQRDPELLVELVEVEDVGAPLSRRTWSTPPAR